MKKIPTVTIGIPAYNEEANIADIIQQLLQQSNTGYILKKIIVISDASTDGTESQVRGIKDKRIVLLSNHHRVGASETQNRIVRLTGSDILILINADILIKDKQLISKATKTLSDKKVGLVSVKTVPFGSKNLIQKAINHSMKFKTHLFASIKLGESIYSCDGKFKAFSKKLYKNIKWDKKVVAEDAFSYLRCRELNLKFKFIKNSEIIYQTPDNIKDHAKQSIRFSNNRKDLLKYFSKELVTDELNIPKSKLLYSFIVSFVKNPLLMLMYLSIILIGRISHNHRVSEKWSMALSTKSFTNI